MAQDSHHACQPVRSGGFSLDLFYLCDPDQMRHTGDVSESSIITCEPEIMSVTLLALARIAFEWVVMANCTAC